LSAEHEQVLNDIDRTLLDLAGGEDGPIVVDVHTNPAEQQVVEEAIAWAREVRAGTARGARFDHRELKQPLAQRLTDSAWIARLHKERDEADTDEPGS
jgi:hypothetical protein